MPTSLGPAEILVILVVALVVLGPKRLPEAGRQIGRFVSEVRHWSSAVQAEIRDVIDLEGEPQPPPPATAPPPPATAAQPSPLPTPQDLGTPATSPPPPAARATAAAEWGLVEPSPPSPQPAHPTSPTEPPAETSAPAPTTSALPPEWATPSSNGDS